MDRRPSFRPPAAWRGAPVPEEPVLVGERVRLVPLAAEHAPELRIAGADPAIWTHLVGDVGPFATAAAAVAWIDAALSDRHAGVRVPFAVTLCGPSGSTGRTIGSTSVYFETRWPNRTLEIGSTWLAVDHWRTGANREAKRLLLDWAFDGLGAERVEFLTDARNTRSQRALEGIGAQREGLFRSHVVLPDGTLRDSIGYAVVRTDWTLSHGK